MTKRPTATRRRGLAPFILLAVAALVCAYAGWRAMSLFGAGHVPGVAPVIYLAGLGFLVWELVVAAQEPRYRANAVQQAALDELTVVALVPVYNEDPQALRDCLTSLLDQSRPLTAIAVVDDGSTTTDYASVAAWFHAACHDAGVLGRWTQQPNGGKRQAQVAGWRMVPDADIICTVDSDTLVDHDAVQEGLRPFLDQRIQSVAGIVLTANYRANVLTRMQELWFTTLQMVSRGALSRMGSVMVNCGGLAFYRAEVLTDNMETYLGERLLGKPMHASDDSLLTLFALRRGRAVQQPSAFAFTLMPTTFDHHRRQQLRWLRGSFVRSGWRLRYLPMGRFAFWQHLFKWAQYAAVTAVAIALVVTGTILHPQLILWTLIAVTAVQFIYYSPYFSLRRSDQRPVDQLLVYLTAPLIGLWQITVMRVLRLYAMATFGRVATHWGTRATVEVALEGPTTADTPHTPLPTATI